MSNTSAARTALVVRGGWGGHQPVATTNLFLPHLEANGFALRVEDSTAVYADADYLATVDLIVQCVSMGTIARDEVEGLRRAVENGTGFAGWHGGIVDSYRDSAEYLQLVGGQFVAHPGNAPGRSIDGLPDSHVRHTIEMLPAAAEHPITAGISDFELTTEQYWVLHDDYNDVLATTTQAERPGDAWGRPITSPAIWTRQWGAGRIFVATPGHDVDVLQNPNVLTIIERGLLWASRRPN